MSGNSVALSGLGLFGGDVSQGLTQGYRMSPRWGIDVEQLGSGIPRILRKYDNTVYHFTENFIRVIFFEAGSEPTPQATMQVAKLLRKCRGDRKKLLAFFLGKKAPALPAKAHGGALILEQSDETQTRFPLLDNDIGDR